MTYPVVKLGDVVTTTSGGTPSRGNKSYYGGDIPWVKSGELPDGDIVHVEETITQDGLDNSSAKLVPSGTLLIAMYGATVGKLGILRSPAATNQAVCAIYPSAEINRDYLFYWLLCNRDSLIKSSFGGAQPNISQTVIRGLEVTLPPLDVQQSIVRKLTSLFSEVEKAYKAAEKQLDETVNLANSIIADSLNSGKCIKNSLGNVLDEVKKGIGDDWQQFPVLGATRKGLALAKEPVGKHPHKYKPVIPGTVFYNPMRILIGSIAFVDDGTPSGITSPDYVALRGKEGVVDSRWFYYWLRSPLGEQCINSLARGAVRERMLFNRLSTGVIELPDYSVQKAASEALKAIEPLRTTAQSRLRDINALPEKLMSQAFHF